MVKIEDGFLIYPCGCKFEVIQTRPLRIRYNPDMDYVPLDCSLTWELLGSGNTKGVFQLETRLGQQSSKKLKPGNIEELAALSAIMRPGCLQARRTDIDPMTGEEGKEKSITDHFIDRKNGVEPVVYYHDALEPILSTTYGEMIYQEQAMQIAQVIAGFDLQQADVLRKAIGKKKADIMAQVKTEFLEGCKNLGIVTEHEAEEIFGAIEKSQRYSFNKSHSVSYAMNGYMSAYAKAHFPVSFFTSYLHFAKDKQKKFDEIKLLVANANIMGVKVKPPDFRRANKHFKRLEVQLHENVYEPYADEVYFGLSDIKAIGDSSVAKINTSIYQVEMALGKTREDWTWMDFLMFFSQEITSTSVQGMIETGALDYFRVSRQQMLFDYEQFSELTKKEIAWIKQKINNPQNLEDMLTKALLPHDNKEKGPCANKNRVQKVKGFLTAVQNPPFSLKDSAHWIARVEEAKLGISLTASMLDDCKNIGNANCNCVQFLRHEDRTSDISIAAQIDEVKTLLDKNNNEMAFVTISDSDAQIDCVIFKDEWPEIQMRGACVKDNTVLVSGVRSRTNPDSLIIQKVWQLS